MKRVSKIRERLREREISDQSLFQTAPPMPKNMMVELSNACNHNCIFCTNPHMQRKKARIEASLLERILREAAESGVTDVGFYTTGDAFMHKDLENFTKSASDLGFTYIYVSTNGALATPDRAKRLMDAGIHSIKFSVNAGTRQTYQTVHGHDDWNKVLAHLSFISDYRKTLERSVGLYLTYVVTKQNHTEVDIARELFEPLVDDVVFYPCNTQASYMDGAIHLLSPGPLPHSPSVVCSQPFNRMHITCEGYLTLCCADYQNYLTVADLKQVSLSDAWHCEPFQKARQLHLEQRLQNTLCGNCWQGRRDPIEPLVPELASIVDQNALRHSQADKVQLRLRVLH